MLGSSGISNSLSPIGGNGAFYRYVWLATNTAEGTLVGDGILFTSRAKSAQSSGAKAFYNSWRGATTLYNQSLYGAMDEVTKLPLFDPTGSGQTLPQE